MAYHQNKKSKKMDVVGKALESVEKSIRKAMGKARKTRVGKRVNKARRNVIYRLGF